MRVVVTKPLDGKTNVLVDDSRGATGLKKAFRAVPVGDVANVIAPSLAQWGEAREAIREVRRQARLSR